MNHTKYFSHCQTVAEIKSEYRRLALANHPDRGGDTRTMQIINAEYKQALENCHGETSTGSDGKEHTYYYNEAVEQAVMDKVAEFFALKLPDSVEIELIGTWLWVSGDTRPHKEKLGKNGLGFFWNNRRTVWQFKASKSRSRYNPDASIDDLRASYGSRKFQDDDNRQSKTRPMLGA